MIVFLRGRVFARHDGMVDIDVQGVGRRVFVTDRTLSSLALREDCFLHIYQHLREDAEELFGFLEEAERTLFIQLIGVTGIGPKSALAIVGTSTVSELTRILDTEDVAALCRFPGIGKKTAARLVLELRGKLTADVGGDATRESIGVSESAGLSSVEQDVRDALVSFGYSERESLQAVSAASKALPGVDFETLFKQALQYSYAGSGRERAASRGPA
jgi:Holliday junction DNA helicase RuvA